MSSVHNVHVLANSLLIIYIDIMHIGGEGQYITKGHHSWKRIGTKEGVIKKDKMMENGEKEKGKGKGHGHY